MERLLDLTGADGDLGEGGHPEVDGSATPGLLDVKLGELVLGRQGSKAHRNRHQRSRSMPQERIVEAGLSSAWSSVKKTWTGSTTVPPYSVTGTASTGPRSRAACPIA
jgi:hypothetical protein